MTFEELEEVIFKEETDEKLAKLINYSGNVQDQEEFCRAVAEWVFNRGFDEGYRKAIEDNGVYIPNVDGAD